MNCTPDIPIYAFIKRELKNRIENGELPEGSRIPSELELARQYNVSRNPTRQALRDLELEGYIVRTPGRGSFVAPAIQRQRLLKVNEWRTVAVACPQLEFHYTRTVIRGFIQSAAERGFHTMVYFLRFNDDTEFAFLADLRNSGLEGMAIWIQHPSEQTFALLQRFRRAAYPFVLIDRYVRGLEADCVVSDNEDVGYRLTKQLIGRGHRNIGFISGESKSTTAEDRFRGYVRALQETGLPFIEDLTGSFEDFGAPASSVVNGIMAHRCRPTAFLCNNDGVAVKLYEALDELGYGVPGEVELAAVDDNELSGALDIPLVTASQRGYEMGRVSADLLIRRIEMPGRPVQRRFLKAAFPEEECARHMVAL